ncbi:branched-chain amino acid ABC transporter permease [Nocardioides zeae]|uniref:Branched-chain amino acid ABC transporter permease n=1 Tax=Nocardioides zeae TaxID=1457234 RepID=A0A6P0HGB4_9ACTN|nr:branched-chain amino acid ABC transporter permease [Nocardioides zeae]NEN77739.1 branched-chain amino acid ABC transporter permease [Nocardioides zeae]
MDAVVSGIVLAGLYALVGQGLVLTFVTTRTLNFASGELLAVGGFLALGVGSWSWLPTPGKLAVVVLVGGALGAVVHRWLVLPFARGEHDSRWLLSTVGISYVLLNLFTNGEGANPQRVELTRNPGTVEVLGVGVNKQSLVIAVIAVVVTLALVAASRWTSGGVIMRAVAEDPRTVALMGISPRLVGAVAYAAATALAALAGVLWASEVGATPGLGVHVLVSAFAVAVIGGLTSFWGPLVGAVVFGVVVQVSAYELGALWGQVAGLALVIVVLVLRPEGLVGRRMEAKL